MTALDDLFFQLLVVFDDPVVDQHHVTRAMGMRVLGRGLSVSRPARVADAASRLELRFSGWIQKFLDVLELAFGFTDFDFAVFGDECDARGIIARGIPAA